MELASEGKQIPTEIDNQMRMFHTHQSETLRVHGNYLNQQSQQSQTALKISQMELGYSDKDIKRLKDKQII